MATSPVLTSSMFVDQASRAIGWNDEHQRRLANYSNIAAQHSVFKYGATTRW